MSKNSERNIRSLHLDWCKPSDMVECKLPIIEPCNYMPPRLISFRECQESADYEAGVHFFVDDVYFEKVWSNPTQWIKHLSKFSCVITPDFSVYCDAIIPSMWNIYRSRMFGKKLQDCGLKVIPAVPCGTYELTHFALLGLPQNSLVCVSTVGARKRHNSRMAFQAGIDIISKFLQTSGVLVYGELDSFDYHNLTARHLGQPADHVRPPAC